MALSMVTLVVVLYLYGLTAAGEEVKNVNIFQDVLPVIIYFFGSTVLPSKYI